jgi:hypothetical protein
VTAGYEARQRWAAAREIQAMPIPRDLSLSELRALGRQGTPLSGWL